jgi:hypothetical protein
LLIDLYWNLETYTYFFQIHQQIHPIRENQIHNNDK